MIYRLQGEELHLVRNGPHADLFNEEAAVVEPASLRPIPMHIDSAGKEHPPC